MFVLARMVIERLEADGVFLLDDAAAMKVVRDLMGHGYFDALSDEGRSWLKETVCCSLRREAEGTA